MPRPTDRRKWKMARNRCVHQRIPTTLLATPPRRKVTTTTLAARTNPSVSPVYYGEWERGTLDALQEGRATPASVTVSVSRRQGFLPTPKKPHLGRSVALHQSCPPRTHATTILQSPFPHHHGPCCEASKTEKKGLMRRRLYGSMLEQQQGQPGPH
jgi:hypothetical protein